MKGLARAFEAEPSVARAELFSRGFLLLLAFDAWLLGLPAAGRYGLAGFNVAHFAWLDRLLPVPSPGLAVGLLALAGLLALSLALVGARRGPVLALFSLYTLAWSISMIDSYQHHYLLSILLLCVAFFPGRASGSRFAQGPGVAMLLASVAIVYAYTALAKLDASWLEGHTLRTTPGVERRLGGLVELFAGLGLDPVRFWAFLASAVIPLELFLALAYLVALARDRSSRAWLRRVCALALVAALLLHGGIELVGLRIGWFSYYMLWLALCFLAPLGAVERGEALVARALGGFEAALPVSRRARDRALAGALAAAVLLLAVGAGLDLPGALAACALAAGALVALALFARRAAPARDARPWVRAAFAAALGLQVAVATSRVRWDFYRERAGDLVSLGELDSALDAYRLAERFAPRGETRAAEIEALEQRLGR